MEGVIAARAKQLGLTYEEMEAALSRKNLAAPHGHAGRSRRPTRAVPEFARGQRASRGRRCRCAATSRRSEFLYPDHGTTTIMAKTRKVIITCAPTGAIHTPSMSPYLPVTPDEIGDAALAAAREGAAILHLHARDPEDGRPTQDPAVFRTLPAAHQGARPTP